jgi:hypothetical protein
MIARFHGADAIADAHDFAGTVGHRDAAVGRLDPAGDDSKVVKVQRTRVQFDQNLPWPGDRLGASFDDDLVEPPWGFHGGDLHGKSPVPGFQRFVEPSLNADRS